MVPYVSPLFYIFLRFPSNPTRHHFNFLTFASKIKMMCIRNTLLILAAVGITQVSGQTYAVSFTKYGTREFDILDSRSHHFALQVAEVLQ